jgi:hypothetical protein
VSPILTLLTTCELHAKKKKNGIGFEFGIGYSSGDARSVPPPLSQSMDKQTDTSSVYKKIS